MEAMKRYYKPVMKTSDYAIGEYSIMKTWKY